MGHRRSVRSTGGRSGAQLEPVGQNDTGEAAPGRDQCRRRVNKAWMSIEASRVTPSPSRDTQALYFPMMASEAKAGRVPVNLGGMCLVFEADEGNFA